MKTMIILAAALVAAPVQGQDLPAKIAASRGEKVTFTFDGREGICGNGESFNIGGVRRQMHGDGWDCVEGPVRVTLTRATAATRDRGTWSRLKVTVASRAPEGAEDLGMVAPAEASDWLLDLAEAGDPRIGNDAVMPGVVGRGVVTWPRLAAMAKRQQLPEEIRKQAIFWLGQEAADEAVGTLEDVVDDPEREMRKAALFALSQLGTDRSIVVLVRVARTHPDKETRRNAFFWLGQTEDPRGIALFEEVLAGR
jgi:hypothetical protein